MGWTALREHTGAVTAAPADDYLASLEPDRRAVLSVVVDLVRRALPPGYEESVAHGMPTWSVPLALLAEAIASTGVDDCVALYESARSR